MFLFNGLSSMPPSSPSSPGTDPLASPYASHPPSAVFDEFQSHSPLDDVDWNGTASSDVYLSSSGRDICKNQYGSNYLETSPQGKGNGAAAFLPENEIKADGTSSNPKPPSSKSASGRQKNSGKSGRSLKPGRPSTSKGQQICCLCGARETAQWRYLEAKYRVCNRCFMKNRKRNRGKQPMSKLAFGTVIHFPPPGMRINESLLPCSTPPVDVLPCPPEPEPCCGPEHKPRAPSKRSSSKRVGKGKQAKGAKDEEGSLYNAEEWDAREVVSTPFFANSPSAAATNKFSSKIKKGKTQGISSGGDTLSAAECSSVGSAHSIKKSFVKIEDAPSRLGKECLEYEEVDESNYPHPTLFLKVEEYRCSSTNEATHKVAGTGAHQGIFNPTSNHSSNGGLRCSRKSKNPREGQENESFQPQRNSSDSGAGKKLRILSSGGGGLGASVSYLSSPHREANNGEGGSSKHPKSTSKRKKRADVSMAAVAGITSSPTINITSTYISSLVSSPLANVDVLSRTSDSEKYQELCKGSENSCTLNSPSQTSGDIASQHYSSRSLANGSYQKQHETHIETPSLNSKSHHKILSSPSSSTAVNTISLSCPSITQQRHRRSGRKRQQSLTAAPRRRVFLPAASASAGEASGQFGGTSSGCASHWKLLHLPFADGGAAANSSPQKDFENTLSSFSQNAKEPITEEAFLLAKNDRSKSCGLQKSIGAENDNDDDLFDVSSSLSTEANPTLTSPSVPTFPLKSPSHSPSPAPSCLQYEHLLVDPCCPVDAPWKLPMLPPPAVPTNFLQHASAASSDFEELVLASSSNLCSQILGAAQEPNEEQLLACKSLNPYSIISASRAAEAVYASDEHSQQISQYGTTSTAGGIKKSSSSISTSPTSSTNVGTTTTSSTCSWEPSRCCPAISSASTSASPVPDRVTLDSSSSSLNSPHFSLFSSPVISISSFSLPASLFSPSRVRTSSPPLSPKSLNDRLPPTVFSCCPPNTTSVLPLTPSSCASFSPTSQSSVSTHHYPMDLPPQVFSEDSFADKSGISCSSVSLSGASPMLLTELEHFSCLSDYLSPNSTSHPSSLSRNIDTGLPPSGTSFLLSSLMPLPSTSDVNECSVISGFTNRCPSQSPHQLLAQHSMPADSAEEIDRGSRSSPHSSSSLCAHALPMPLELPHLFSSPRTRIPFHPSVPENLLHLSLQVACSRYRPSPVSSPFFSFSSSSSGVCVPRILMEDLPSSGEAEDVLSLGGVPFAAATSPSEKLRHSSTSSCFVAQDALRLSFSTSASMAPYPTHPTHKMMGTSPLPEFTEITASSPLLSASSTMDLGTMTTVVSQASCSESPTTTEISSCPSPLSTYFETVLEASVSHPRIFLPPCSLASDHSPPLNPQALQALVHFASADTSSLPVSHPLSSIVM